MQHTKAMSTTATSYSAITASLNSKKTAAFGLQKPYWQFERVADLCIIKTGNGDDIVIGGAESDTIEAGTDASGDVSRDIVLGDSGRAEFDTTGDLAFIGSDLIPGDRSASRTVTFPQAPHFEEVASGDNIGDTWTLAIDSSNDAYDRVVSATAADGTKESMAASLAASLRETGLFDATVTGHTNDALTVTQLDYSDFTVTLHSTNLASDKIVDRDLSATRYLVLPNSGEGVETWTLEITSEDCN